MLIENKQQEFPEFVEKIRSRNICPTFYKKTLIACYFPKLTKYSKLILKTRL